MVYLLYNVDNLTKAVIHDLAQDKNRTPVAEFKSQVYRHYHVSVCDRGLIREVKQNLLSNVPAADSHLNTSLSYWMNLILNWMCNVVRHLEGFA